MEYLRTSNHMNLRKYKAARLKLDVLEQAVRLIGKKPYQDLHVADICRRVKVSKVTFFNYFPSKEDLLMYWHRVWLYTCMAEMHSKPKSGLAGISYLADSLAEEAATHPGFLYSLIGYLNDQKRPVKPYPVETEEKNQLFPKLPDLANQEIPSLENLIHGFVQQAVDKKELSSTIPAKELTSAITSVILGSLMAAQLSKPVPPAALVRRNLDLALKGLKKG